MAELNGKKYESWEEYIEDKFPTSEFNIQEERDTDSSKIIIVTTKNKTSETRLVFDFPTSGLCRFTFYHPNSPFLNMDNDEERKRALMYADFEISNENLLNMDETISIPLHYGWIEETTYYADESFISNLRYYDNAWHTIPLKKKKGWFSKSKHPRIEKNTIAPMI